MRIFFGSENFKIGSSAVALGDLDAIHKGHIEIIKDTVKYGKNNGLLSVVYMFSTRPNKASGNINTTEKRIEILEKMGVDALVIEEFTTEYKNTACEDFVKIYLSERLQAQAVFAGFNYRFGKDAKGDAETLERLCEKDGIKTFIKDCVKVGGVAVSSTAIRRFIEQGEVKKAAELMTRYFSLSGRVVKGKQIGRTIGFPTANIKYPDGIIIPRCGVYISRSKIGENKYYSITNVGEKPTVADKSKNIETAIGDFSDNIYGEKIEIEFCERLRDIEKFESLDALKTQLEDDMKKSREFFEKEKKNEQLS